MLFFERLAQLEREHASFAVATVVARRSPVSSHLGDRALIFADGHMEGFVGGSCSRDIVRRHAVRAIRNRQPVLLQIRPDSRGAAGAPSNQTADGPADLVVIPMSCASEGAVDVYIEPRVPLRRLVIVGFTPVAEALAQAAVALDYDVVRVVTDDELRDIGAPAQTRQLGGPATAAVDAEPHAPGPEDRSPGSATNGVRVVELKALRGFLAGLDADTERDLVAVVASQGHYDELALEALLERPIAFIGLLASRRRAQTVAGVLAQQGLAADRIAAIQNPVGLDIGARSPGEVAISILAHIIAQAKNVTAIPSADETGATVARRHHHPSANAGSPEPALDMVEADPVCGMDVQSANALHRYEHAGQTYVFCGAHCRASFSADPGHYLLPLGTP